MADGTKMPKSIPSWQQAGQQKDSPEKPEKSEKSEKPADSTQEAGSSNDDVLEVARQFLKDESIRNAPRYDKVEYLKEKGLSTEEIDKLLAEHDGETVELKTVHDTSDRVEDNQQKVLSAPAPEASTAQIATQEPKQEMAPIITYPEFLLKPQKPPPLITVNRLVNAAYAVAGVSALTWAASKYLVEPMIQTLTEARHDFASTSLADLEQLNDRLESMVSHVPYIASSAVKKQQEQEDDVESLDSDPTELFHRDVAVQTSPGLSRSSSEASVTKHTLDPTISQAERLSGLSYSLRSLVTSLEHANDNEKYLQKTVEEMQGNLDKMESSYGYLKNDYGYGSRAINADDVMKKAVAGNEGQKFKQEIRALKGAFLSSRNFPTAPRPAGPVSAGGAGNYGSR